MSNYLFKHSVTPLNNVDGNFVNVDNSSWPGRFGSIETSRQFALPDNFSNNAAAANASRISGGGKKKQTLRKKIKNIVNKYRMTSKKMRKNTKRRLLSLYKKKSSHANKKNHKTRRHRHRRGGNTVLNHPLVPQQNLHLVNGTNAYVSAGPVAGVTNPYNVMGGKRRHKKQKGGYHQFQSDIPITPSYSRGGVLGPSDLALANPAPYTLLPNCTNCVDNYNYNTNRGFQAW